MSRGLAVEQLFRETLKRAGHFQHVVSTKIDKSTADRPHFFIAYGTKSRDGLKAFRQIEYDALREHARNRANAKERRGEERSNIPDLFSGHEAEVQEASVDDLVSEQKRFAMAELQNELAGRRSISFSEVVDEVLEAFMLRETNVKDICVELADAGIIERTWGGGNRKPHDTDVIRLKLPPKTPG